MKAYIGIAEDGCVLARVVDCPGEEEFTADDVASFKASGLRVEYVDIEESEHRMKMSAQPCSYHPYDQKAGQ